MFKDLWKRRAAQVEADLLKELRRTKSLDENLMRAMEYSLMAGGKRLRPILLMAAADAVNGTGEKFITVADAVEMIHTYSLIHDDLPAMDDDDYRRGKLTNHKVFGEATAILAGDALLTLAFEVALRQKDVAPEILLKVLEEISTAAGAAGMVGGQAIDLRSEGIQIDFATLKLGRDSRSSVRKKVGGSHALRRKFWIGFPDNRRHFGRDGRRKNFGQTDRLRRKKFKINLRQFDFVGRGEKFCSGRGRRSFGRAEKFWLRGKFFARTRSIFNRPKKIIFSKGNFIVCAEYTRRSTKIFLRSVCNEENFFIDVAYHHDERGDGFGGELATDLHRQRQQPDLLRHGLRAGYVDDVRQRGRHLQRNVPHELQRQRPQRFD